MKPKQKQRWEAVRAKGKTRFVLMGGLLSWGLPMFVVMTFIVNRGKLNPGYIAVSAVMWSLGGLAFGFAMWWMQERTYNKALEEESGVTDER